MRTLLVVISLLISDVSFSQLVWKDVGNAFPANNNPPYGFGVYKGELYVGGEFGSAGGLAVSGIARWNGQNWNTVGKGITSIMSILNVFCFEEYNNELIMGGSFLEVDSLQNTTYIAQWDGTNWSSISNKLPDGNVHALKYKNNLYVGGGFWTIYGVAKTKCISKWDGTNWSSVGGGLNGMYPQINTMAVYKDELYVGGTFEYANDTNLICNYIARWNGIKWDTLGSGVNGIVGSMIVDTIENILYVSGGFNQAGGIHVSDTTAGLAKWDGNNWSAMPAFPPVNTSGGRLAMYRDMLFLGGAVNSSADTALAFWDGQIWHPIVPGPNGPIIALKVYNDELYIGGGFDKIDTMNVNCIARLWMPPLGEEDNKCTDELMSFKIYPNPNNGKMQLLYILKEGEIGELCIKDIAGKVIICFNLNSNSNSMQIDMDLMSEIYFYSVKVNGETIHSDKLVIIK